MGKASFHKVAGIAVLMVLVTTANLTPGLAGKIENKLGTVATEVQGEKAGQTSTSNGPTSESALDDETLTWKTYSNKQYGFELRYPPDFLVSEKDSEGIVSREKQIVSFEPPESLYQGGAVKKGLLRVVICDSASNDRFAMIPKKMEATPFNYPRLENVNGLSFYRFCVIGIDEPTAMIMLRTIHNDWLYEVDLSFAVDDSSDFLKMAKTYGSFELPADDAVLVDWLNQMLSTFHFTGHLALAEDTSKWETYTDEEDGFTFKYSSDSLIAWVPHGSYSEVYDCVLGFEDVGQKAELLRGAQLVAQLPIPSHVFLPVGFDKVTASTPESGNMYLYVLPGSEAGGDCKSLSQEEIEIEGREFYHRSTSDCDPQGCRDCDIFFISHKNACYIVSFDTWIDSGYHKGAPVAKDDRFIVVQANRERYHNFCRQLMSTFRFLK
jgi:hypothetical protein